MMRGAVSVVLVTGVAVAAIAAVLAWPRSFEGILPSTLVDRLAEPGPAPASPDADAATAAARSDETPAAFLVDGPEGLVADGPIAAMAGNVPVFISDVVIGYSTRVGDDVPAEITTIRPIMGCLVTPPLTGTVVGNVVGGQSGRALGLLTYNDTDLAEAVQVLVETYRQTGLAEVAVPAGLAYQVHDVVVTEVTAPVYLVLQASEGNVIWNIHTTPGVRIERVVLLGGDQAGVANLDPVVPVEVILQDGLQACGVRPAHALNAGHALVQAAASGDVAAMDALAAQRADADAYGLWFRDTFGILSGPTRAGFDVGAVSVVGSLPGGGDPAVTPKATFAGIDGAKIRTTQDTFFEIPGQAPANEDFAARVKAITTVFAFGDLGNLRQGVDF
mgnify:CR=1 FL=1